MATQENLNLAQQLYVAYYGRPADAAGLEFWANDIEANGVDSAISAFGTSEEYTARFGELSNEELVKGIYQQAFGRDAEAEGLEFWTGKLESGELDLATIALAVVQGASDSDQLDATTLANKVAAADLYTEAAGDAHSGTDADEYAADILADINAGTDLDSLDVNEWVEGIPSAPEGPEEPSTPGESIQLTANADRVEGTANDDTYEASITTINFRNGNTLNSGDVLDGGAGNDTLNAQLINDAFVAGGAGAVRPSTENVENVVVNAIETGNSFSDFAGSTVVLNAADMYDLDNVWSKDSNANLVIQDITTKTSDGGVRNTEDLTFRMDHTSNANSGNSNQSDMTVYFDENYLLAGRVEDASRVQYEVMNQDAWDLINVNGENDVELLDGVFFQRLSFTLNGETVNLHPLLGEEGIAGDGLEIRTHEELVDAINGALEELGLNDQVTASLGTKFTERSGTDVTEGRDAPSVVLSGVPGVELGANENFAFLAAADESPIRNSNRYDRANESVIEGADEKITTNVELHKAGRGDDGGDFYVGGKAGGSIEVFNVDVFGGDEKPSNIGWLNTGQNEDGMDQVNIVSNDSEHAAGAKDWASLTIRNGFDNDEGLVSTVNANGFLGDLTVGNEDRVANVAEFSATGGGDVEYYADYATTLDHTIVTGNGDDVIDVILSETASESDASRTSVDITSTGGDNTVTLSSKLEEVVLDEETGDVISSEETVNDATVTTGDGNDVITGGYNDVTVESGAGNDDIYVENTGDRTTATLAAPAEDSAFADSEDAVDVVELLNNRNVTVTLQLPGDHGAVDSFNNGIERSVTVQARDGVITDAVDLYTAVAELINTDRVFSSLAEATVTSEGNLVVDYLVDGETVVGDELVSIETRSASNVENSDFNNSLISALQEKYSDSTIGASVLADAYTNASAEAVVLAPEDEGANSVSEGGENVVNAGTGNDVIVLSSDDATQDTVVIDASDNFGRNTIAHFNDGEDGDVLDFTAWLNNEASSSGSAASRDRIDTSLDLKANGVHIIDFDELDGNNTNFGNLTEAQVANGIDDFGNSSSKAIVMVEDGNNGVYNVYEVTGGDNNQASLVGVMDFAESQDFTIDNFA